MITFYFFLQKGRRYRALMILDAAFIYGIDIQNLPLVERMAHIRSLCNILDFPETDCAKVICPPCRPLTSMPDFIDG